MNTRIIKLPNELIFKITDFLDPFDIINLYYIYNIPYDLENDRTKLKTQVKIFSQNNHELIQIIYNIINCIKFIDYSILSILRDIEYLSKKMHQMKITNSTNLFSHNIIYIRIGTPCFNELKLDKVPYIIKSGNPILYGNSHIINIYYPNIWLLQKYLSKFLKYKLKKNYHNLIIMSKSI